MRNLHKIVVLGAVVIGATAASAATTFVENFDEPISGLNNGGFVQLGAGSALGVFTAGSNGVEIQRNYPGLSPADSGSQLVELDVAANSSIYTAISGGNYTLKFAYSARPGVGAASNGIDVFIGSTLLGSYAEDGTGLNNTAFSIKTLNFTTGGGNLSFVASGTNDSLGGFIDSVSLQAAVPEPASWAMMLGGFGLIGGAMRSRRRSIVSFA